MAVKVTLPSPQAKRVRIGASYQPTRAVLRTATEYRELMPEPGTNALRLQSALLGSGLGRLQRIDPDLIVGVACVLAVAALGAMHMAGWLSGGAA